jgi:NADP+-dependent farnesol dehydrogenase
MDRWKGKVAVVTGASSAIGAAICKALVEKGMVVCGLSKRKSKVETLKTALFDTPGTLNAIECDIRDEGQVSAVFRWIDEKYGSVDLLINSASVVSKGLLLDENNTSELYNTMETNIIGLCIVTREAVKNMKKRPPTQASIGHIVNINSIFGHKVNACVPGSKPLNGMYPASKHAVTAITECVRQELLYLDTKIKITSISPGLVDSDIICSDADNEILKLMPTLHPKDVASAVLYAISVPEDVQIHEIVIKPVGEFL